ncbi:universal stress protein [Aquabacterium sp. J223]|uniref:universal stress protein n=1 Tax=Aquabacterium sp. J223 TaxID=2898431 RepID=UPI0021AD5EA3|nr:universal stress protein [Aquabacterium sp. J223]UUX95021.1 universal stress protein [Aquabacterium sp. J223]
MKILVAVDGSDYTKRLLAWLATHDELLAKEVSYTFIAVVPPLPPIATHHIEPSSIDGHYTDTAKAVLDPVAEFARRHGWRFDTRAPVGRAGNEIAKAATGDRYDLVAMGSHGHSAVGSLVMGSVTQQVLASCRVPVLIVR